ncbi:hypothetical protein MMC12_006602 [Toensbergia leucococca]|nr:hypothetical protein [Toensbergia leucococca]
MQVESSKIIVRIQTLRDSLLPSLSAVFSLIYLYLVQSFIMLFISFRLQLLSILAASLTSASTTFSPDCASPPAQVNFVSSPSVRGTLDILWSSIFTLLLCTWTIQHLNVPDQKPEEVPGLLWALLRRRERKNFREALRWSINGVWYKTKWVLTTLLVPEFLVGKALQDLVLAIHYRNRMRQMAEKDGVEWSLAHAYYANMGGFVARIESTSASHSNFDQRNSAAAQKGASQDGTLVSQSNIRGVASGGRTNNSLERPKSEGHTQAVDPESEAMITETAEEASQRTLTFIARTLIEARKSGLISRLPSISLREIEGRSKGDAFVKGSAIIQVLWMTIQCIVRATRHLPITQLEVAVLAFAVCALLTYLLNWSKPQGVEVPTYIKISGNTKYMKDLMAREDLGTGWFGSVYQGNGEGHVPNDLERYDAQIWRGTGTQSVLDVGVVIAGSCFGVLHCLAWNFHFPSHTEMLLWRIAALITALVTLIFFLLSLVDFHVKDGILKRLVNFIVFSFYVVSIAAYVLARLYLMVEIFRSLFFLPPEAFVTTWSAGIPHVG